MIVPWVRGRSHPVRCVNLKVQATPTLARAYEFDGALSGVPSTQKKDDWCMFP